MKKLFRILAVLSVLSFVLVGQAFAYPVDAGDSIVLTKTKVGGGYYYDDDEGRQWYGGGDFGVSLSGTGDVLFTTFCVEMDVHMALNTPYRVSSIENYVERQGVNRNLAGGTKWLYWNFDKGTLAGLSDYNYTQDGVRALQEAIWALEGYAVTLSDLARSLYDLGGSNAQVGNSYDVKVMNLVDSNNSNKQSQLVAAPVPEPATMVLLGSGLIGLALYRRRMKK